MKIFHPQSGMNGAQRDHCFLIQDDAGVELGQGSVLARNMREVYPERPMQIALDMDAHPRARDMLFGALRAQASALHRQAGAPPARLYTECQMGDMDRYNYFKFLGFDDADGDELFLWRLSKHERTVYPPLSTQIIDIPRRSRAESEALVRRMQTFGAGEHAVEWLDDAARTPNFCAFAVYGGSELWGEVVTTGEGQEARIEALYTTPKYRGHDAATALLSQVRITLLERGVRFVRINVPRRNQRALRLLQRAHFEWVRTDRLFLGVDL